ncbi:hypothetical protein PMAYCL1PPCAC_00817, partial [Pristionchus mayeri]
DWVLCSGQCYCQFYFDSVFPFHRSLESYCAQFGQIVEGSIGGGEANSQFHALFSIFSILDIIDLLQNHIIDSRSIVLLLHEFVHSVIEMSGDLRCVVQISAFFVGVKKEVEDTIESRPRE